MNMAGAGGLNFDIGKGSCNERDRAHLHPLSVLSVLGGAPPVKASAASSSRR